MPSKVQDLDPLSILKLKRSIVYSGASRWNALKTETKNIDMFEIFKYQQKKEIFTF